jgi:hypothetical protein
MVFLLFNRNARVTENSKPQNQNEKTQKIKTEADVEPQIVSLNVGGYLFSTTTSTLLNVQTTFFSESHQAHKDGILLTDHLKISTLSWNI